MTTEASTHQALLAEIDDLRIRLEEAEDTLRAINAGEIDALVVETAEGSKIFTVQGQDAELNRFRGQILGQVSDAVIVLDDGQHLAYLNDAAEQQYGVVAFEVLGRHISEMYRSHWFHPEDEHAMAAALNETGQWRGENIHVKRNGETIHVESTITVLHSGNGTHPGLVAVIRDISDRKRMQEKLLDSEAFIRNILNNSADCIKVIDLKGNLVYMNVPGQYDMEIEDFTVFEGMPWVALWPAEGKGLVEAALRTAQAGGIGHFQSFCPTAKGISKWWDVKVTAIPDTNGQARQFVSILRDITEQRLTEAALRESKEQFEAIIGSAMDAIISVDTDQRIVVFNAAAENMFGCPANEAIGCPITRFIPLISTGAHAMHLREFEDTVPSNQAMGQWGDIMGLRAGGDEFPIEASVSQTATGGQKVFTLILRDISERKRAEQALRDSEQRMRLATETTGVGIWEWNIITNKIRWDAEMFRIYGITPTPDGIINYSTWIEAVLPEDVSRQEEILQDTVRRLGHSAREFRILRKNDGERRHIQAVETVRINTQGQAEWVVGTNLDITERKVAETALRESREDFMHAQEVSQLGWWRINISNNTLTWSDENYRIFGVPKSTPLDYESFLNLVHPDDRDFVHARWMAALVGEPYDIEHRIIVGDSIKWLREKAYLEFGEDGKLIGGFGITQDLTERKQAEIALMEADRQKNEFLAMLGHELRNPLTPISNVAQILSSQTLDQSALTKVSDMLNRNVSHISHLVDDLLDVSRITRGLVTIQKEHVGLAELLKQAIESVQDLIKSKRHTINLQLPSQPVYLEGDPVRLTQVFTNLLNNAAKYTGDGGRIDLNVDIENSLVAIRIQDNGMGIEPQLLPYLFDLFTQGERGLARSEGGLGLGLSLVRKLVELHGGEVTASSPGANQGSEFVVKLPRRVEASVQTDPVNSPESNKQTEQGVRVLVIDDNQGVVDSLSLWLEMAGHQVQVASNGTQGISAAQSFAPDIILLDIGLPDMDGYQVAKKLRGQPCTQKALIVALSGYAPNIDSQITEPDGLDHYLVKPPKIKELQELIIDFQRLRKTQSRYSVEDAHLMKSMDYK